MCCIVYDCNASAILMEFVKYNMSRFITKLKHKWNVYGTWSIILILITFTLAGSSTVYFSDKIIRVLNIAPDSSLVLKILLRVLLFFPLHQLLLLVYGTMLGQFNFIWSREKAMGRWIMKRIHNTAGRFQSKITDQKNI